MENEIATKQTYSIREVSEQLGVSYDIIRNAARRLFDDIKQGVSYRLDEVQIAKISMELKRNKDVLAKLNPEEVAKITNAQTRLEVIENYKRATQSYITMLEDEKLNLQIMLNNADKKIKELAPAADCWNTLTEAKDAYNIKDVANTMHCRAKILYAYLADREYICRKLNSCSSDKGKWVATQKGVDSGYILNKIWLDTVDGRKLSGLGAYLTPKGMEFIKELLRDRDLAKGIA